MKHTFIFIGLTVGLLFGMMSCTSKSPGSNTQTVAMADNNNTNVEITEVIPTQSVDTVEATLTDSIVSTPTDSLKKSIYRYAKKGPFVENDTTFLYRSATNAYNGCPEYEDIYIERDRQSKSYQQVLNYASTYLSDHSDVEDFDYQLKYLREKHPQAFPKHTLSDDFPKTWIPICSFQNTYYMNELYAYYTSFFTDSLYIKRDMDGPVPYIIQSFKRVSPTHYLFDLIRYDNRCHLDLQIIDAERKIAIITTDDQESGRKWHTLYIAKDTAPLLDAICWNSTDMPEDTNVDFDEIDFDSLFKQQEQ